MALVSKKKVLIVGIGNTIRGDDGIGVYVCSAIDELNLESVQTLMVQQLDTGLVDEFLKADKIVLVDASVEEQDVNFYLLKNEQGFSTSSSHHVSANLLSSVIKRLYDKEMEIMMCAVRGENFSMGEKLSAIAKQNGDKAVSLIIHWIRTFN